MLRAASSRDDRRGALGPGWLTRYCSLAASLSSAIASHGRRRPTRNAGTHQAAAPSCSARARRSVPTITTTASATARRPGTLRPVRANHSSRRHHLNVPRPLCLTVPRDMRGGCCDEPPGTSDRYLSRSLCTILQLCASVLASADRTGGQCGGRLEALGVWIYGRGSIRSLLAGGRRGVARDWAKRQILRSAHWRATHYV